MDTEEPVILVVGGERESEDKALVADLLAEGRGASQIKTSKAGSRVFRRESSSRTVVVDTSPLLFSYKDFQHDASAWVSQNSLRRMYDKLLYVVCVITSSGPDDTVHQKVRLDTNLFTYSQLSWFQLLTFTFKEKHALVIRILVKLEATNQRGTKMVGIEDLLEKHGFARSNISFETFTREGLVDTVRVVLAESLPQGKANRAKSHEKTARPFLLQQVTSKCRDEDKYGPWGPGRVILFGRTGSGKSTLAQMLTKGRLDLDCTDFTTSDGIRGETKKLTEGEGRGWYVVDTPGFGEPNNKESTVSTADAEKKIKRYVELIGGVYTHFIYVAMKDRIDQLEVTLWNFFLALFGEGGTDWYTVVISNASDKWIEENLAHLQESFKGCKSFSSGEFPPIEVDDEEWETELEDVRTTSLEDLEDELASSRRYLATCEFGSFSKTTNQMAMVRSTTFRSHANSVLDKAVMVFGTRVGKSYWEVTRLMKMLRGNQGEMLLLPC